MLEPLLAQSSSRNSRAYGLEMKPFKVNHDVYCPFPTDWSLLHSAQSSLKRTDLITLFSEEMLDRNVSMNDATVTEISER